MCPEVYGAYVDKGAALQKAAELLRKMYEDPDEVELAEEFESYNRTILRYLREGDVEAALEVSVDSGKAVDEGAHVALHEISLIGASLSLAN
jgi:hypothetical protein